MAIEHPHSSALEPATDLSHLLQLYDFMLENLRYEGNGIWSRFNMMVGIEIALLGAVTYVAAADPRLSSRLEILVALLLVGLTLSIWSAYVLRQLWKWHEHWRNALITIENAFPQGEAWLRPYTSIPGGVDRDLRWNLSWFLAYTHPFFIALASLWIALLILVLSGRV